MKREAGLTVGLALAAIGVLFVAVGCTQQPPVAGAALQPTPQPSVVAHHTAAHDSSDPAPQNKRVPAYLEASAEELKHLPPTLSPAQFFGRARLAYQAVKEIPRTIAQLPCYCYCDEGFGHKSLHSCFENDHASHCAVCVEEALLAHRLQKKEKLTPAAIRERIIKEYGDKH
jgi:hypothetical protein